MRVGVCGWGLQLMVYTHRGRWMCLEGGGGGVNLHYISIACLHAKKGKGPDSMYRCT